MNTQELYTAIIESESIHEQSFDRACNNCVAYGGYGPLIEWIEDRFGEQDEAIASEVAELLLEDYDED